MPSSNNGDITLTVGLDTSSAQATAKELEDEVSRIFESQTGDESPRMTALNAALKKNVLEAQKLQEKLDEASNVQLPTFEYEEQLAYIKENEEELTKLLAQQQEMQQVGVSSGGAWDTLQSRITEVRATIEDAKGGLQTLVDTGKAFTMGSDPEQIAKLELQLDAVNDKTKVNLVKYQQFNKEVEETPEEMNKVVKSSSNIKTALTGVVSKIGEMHKKLPKISSMFNNMKSSVGGVAKSFLKWGLGIASVMALIRKLRSTITEGFKNLFEALPDAPITKQVNNLKDSINQLKNGLAASFTPILQAILPYVQRLVDWLNKAVQLVGQFFAAFTGAKTVLQATKVQGSYNKALKSTAKDAKEAAKETDKANKGLRKFDEINNITTQEDKDNKKDEDSGGAGGLGGFVEVPVDSKIADLVQRIKDMLKKAWEEADFTEIGALLGQKIKDMLDMIPWDYIQEIGRKLGKSIATLINGFVEVEGLGDSIGNAVAQSFNTVIYTIQSFLANLHGISVGDFFGDIVQSFFDNTDWTAIGNTIGLFVSTVLDMVIGFIEKFDFGSIVDAVVDMIKGVDWVRVLTEIGIALLGLGKGIIQIVVGLVGNLSTLLGDLFSALGMDTVAGFFYGFSEKMKEAREYVQQRFQEIVAKVKEFLGIHSPSTLFADIGRMAVQGLINGIQSLIGTVAKIFTDAWEAIKTKTKTAFDYVHYAIIEKVTNIKTSITNMLNSIKSVWTNVWSSLKNTVVSTFSGIWNAIRGTINSILSGIETMANGIVAGINKVVSTLNNLDIDIPSWVPTYGGQSLGFNIPQMSQIRLPRLAQGAVIPPNKEFMAVLGDQSSGTNIEAPLDTIKQAMSEVMAQFSGGETNDIVIQIDGREIARAVVKQDQLKRRSAGTGLFGIA